MEMPMMHRSMWKKMHTKDLADAFDVSVPSAIFGVIVSTMFGMTVGLIMGKRNAMKGYWGHGKDKYWKGHAKMGKEKWMGKEMMYHHHHGPGSQACVMKHEGDQGMMSQTEERNEGE